MKTLVTTLGMFGACFLFVLATSCAEKPAKQSERKPVAAQPTPSTPTAAKPDDASIAKPVSPAQPVQPVEVKAPAVIVPVPAGKPGVLNVPVTNAAPTIDGDLTDSAWAGAATATLRTSDGKEPAVKTRVLVTQDKDNLYVAVECGQKAGADKPAISVKSHDETGIWQDDGVELFIDPTNKRESYYQIIVNAGGTTWDAYHAHPSSPDMGWEPKYKSAVKVTNDAWTIEYALPLSIFTQTPASGETWAFNVQRNAQDSSESVYLSLITDTSHDPSKFGTLTGIKTTWKDRAAGAK